MILASIALALFASVGATLLKPARTAAITTDNTVNFQARLETNTGAIVPDGYYNIEFKIYNVSSGGSAQVTEDYTWGNGNAACTGAPLGVGDCRLKVVNGYFTVNLGSITTGGLPSTISWDQQEYVGMNVALNGTATSGTFPTMGDGEMTPRLLMTAVPFAFRAGQLADPGNTGSILNWAAQGGANTIQLPNAGINVTKTLCLENDTAGCGFAPTTLGTGYIQNQTASPQTSAGFNIATSGQIGTTLAVGGLTTLNGGLTVNTATTSDISVTSGSSVPTADQLNITNAGSTGVITAGVNALSINYKGGAAAVEAAAERIDLQPGTTTGGTWNAIRLVANATGPATGVTETGLKVEGPTVGGAGTFNAVNVANIGAVISGGIVNGINLTGTNSQAAGTMNGININNLTAGAATENAIKVGTGWDNVLQSANTTISQTGNVTLGSTTNVGTLVLQDGTVNNRAVTLNVPALTVGSYTLTLPVLAPTTSQCLQSGSITASQLIFGSCSGAGTTLQGAYNTSAGATPSIALNTTNKALTVQNSVTSGIGAGTEYFGVRAAGASDLVLGNSIFTVNSAGVGINIGGTGNPVTSADLSFGNGGNRTINVIQAASGVGNNLTLQAGQSGTGANNGGNLVLQAGATGGSGTAGSVIVKANGTDTTTAFQIQRAGSTTNLLNADTAGMTLTVQAGTDAAILGSELMTGSESFPATAGWTAISGTGSSATATHTASGGTTALSPTPALTVAASTVYQVTYTISGTPAAGSTLVVSLGGATAASYTFNGTTAGNFTDTVLVTTTGTGNLAFTPSTSFTGTVSGVFVEQLTQNGHPALVVSNASGTPNLEIRASSSVNNFFIGHLVGESDTTGTNNVGFGGSALQNTTSGSNNTAVGTNTLQSNTTGAGNTAIGSNVLQNNTSGATNVGIGNNALQNNLTASNNVGIGNAALRFNTTGSGSVGIGNSAGAAVTTGSFNVGIGNSALSATTTGRDNTALGDSALATNTTGSFNLALGDKADVLTNNLQSAVAIGDSAQVGASTSIVLGFSQANGINDTVGIGTSFAPNELTVAPQTYGTNGSVGAASTISQDNGTHTCPANSGTTITGSSTTFVPGMIGGTIYYSDGTKSTITGFTSTTVLTSSISKCVAAGSTYNIVWGGFNVTSTGTALLQPTTNSTSAFQIQDTSDNTLFTADTVNGRIGIGTAAPEVGLQVQEANFGGGFPFNTLLTDTTAFASGVGGGIGFSGYIDGTGTDYTFSAIQGYKENGTNGNDAGALRFYTRPNGGSLTQALSLSSSGAATFASTVTVQGASVSGSGALTISSGGATALGLDTGGGAAINIGSINATSIILGGNTAGTITEDVANSSTTAFQLQTAGSTKLLTADTTGGKLQVGSSTTDATAILLVLDSFNSSTDPTGTLGAMYYNTADAAFRCYNNSVWTNCVNGPANTITSVPGAWADTAAKSAANIIYITPLYVPGQMTVAHMIADVHTTLLGAAGDIGVYNSAGTLVLNGGSGSLTAAVGLKSVAPTQANKVLEAGQYYVAITWNAATGVIQGQTLAVAGEISRSGTLATGGLVLPSNVTLSTITNSTVVPGITLTAN